MTPTIRPFTADEWPRYREIRLEALREAPDSFGSTWAGESAATAAQWTTRLQHGVHSAQDLPLLAEVAGQAAGLSWARIADADAAIAHLYQMWVDPRYRGQGIGQLLLSRSIAWARSKACRSMVLGVAQGAQSAARLYARMGFVPVGPPGPLRAGSSLQVQELHLAL